MTILFINNTTKEIVVDDLATVGRGGVLKENKHLVVHSRQFDGDVLTFYVGCTSAAEQVFHAFDYGLRTKNDLCDGHHQVVLCTPNGDFYTIRSFECDNGFEYHKVLDRSGGPLLLGDGAGAFCMAARLQRRFSNIGEDIGEIAECLWYDESNRAYVENTYTYIQLHSNGADTSYATVTAADVVELISGWLPQT